MSDSRVARARARRRRTRVRAALAALVAVAVTVAVVVVVVRSGSPAPDDASRRTTPSASPTPLESVDLSDLPVERRPFCDLVEADAVETALGGPVSGTRHYDSGDRVALTAGLTDVAHEFGCTFDAASGAQARAWVFAEPVAARTATALAREAAAAKGCSPVADAPTFGTPTVATYCRTTKPAGGAVTLAGLFGDAWLTCRLTTPPEERAETVRRGEQWCLALATKLGARP